MIDNKPDEREKYYMTQQEIADELGMSKDAVRRLLNDALEKVRIKHPELRELL